MTSPSSPMPRVSTAVSNPIRTGVQGGAGYLIVEFIEAFNLYDFTERQWGLAVLLLGALASAAQNLAENRGWLKPFLRSVPPKTAPIVQDEKPTQE